VRRLLGNRVTELEGQGAFQRVFEAGRVYRTGMAVVRHGNVYVALRQTTTDPARRMMPPEWKRAAMPGRDAKDLR
jgi:hypothetical protein